MGEVVLGVGGILPGSWPLPERHDAAWEFYGQTQGPSPNSQRHRQRGTSPLGDNT